MDETTRLLLRYGKKNKSLWLKLEMALVIAAPGILVLMFWCFLFFYVF